MPLKSPEFDSKTYQQILQEALARIPAHNPEWSNFNDSDPGVTLLQLFAFMSESIIYRTNLIPERNRMKFLKLLGIQLNAASVATGLVQFSSKSSTVLETNIELLAGNVPFRTQNGLHVLALESKLYYKQEVPDGEQSTELTDLYNLLYQAVEQDPEKIKLYTTRIFAPPQAGSLLPVLKLSDTVDACYWLALLAAPKTTPEQAQAQLANQTLSLGIMPALDEQGCVLYPLGPAASTQQPSLIFEIPQVGTADNSAQYKQLTVRSEQDPLAGPGIIELQLPGADELVYWKDLEPLVAGTGNFPPALENTDDATRLITWIRIRASEANTVSAQSSFQSTVALNWLGANAALVKQKTHVPLEQLARGTGQPEQVLMLSNPPIIPESLQLTVNGRIWTQIDDLNAAAAEVPQRSPRLAGKVAESAMNNNTELDSALVYQLDPEAGEIHFGNGLQGKRPPAGAIIQASYDYGGGRQGQVGIAELSKHAGVANLQGVEVSNPVPTWGADDQETLQQAEQRIPATLRHNERLVSATDYYDITYATPGVDIGRVDVLPLFHPDLPDLNSEGLVTVMVIPAYDPFHPDNPEPDRLFLQNICDYLAPRRIVTTELHVRGPLYEDLVVSVGIEVIPGFANAPVVNAVKIALQDFLSPLIGGFAATGWPLNTAVEGAELAAAVTRVEGVASVQGSVLLGDANANVLPSLSLIGLQLPRLAGVSVTVGDALPLVDVLGLSTTTGTDDDALGTPVPIIPEVC